MQHGLYSYILRVSLRFLKLPWVCTVGWKWSRTAGSLFSENWTMPQNKFGGGRNNFPTCSHQHQASSNRCSFTPTKTLEHLAATLFQPNRSDLHLQNGPIIWNRTIKRYSHQQKGCLTSSALKPWHWNFHWLHSSRLIDIFGKSPQELICNTAKHHEVTTTAVICTHILPSTRVGRLSIAHEVV